jgi:O-methyltransferase
MRLFSIVRDVPFYLYAGNSKKIQIHENPKVFATIVKQIRAEGNTFLREDRLYTLFQILKQIPQKTIIVEVGVYKGGSVKFMSSILASEKIEASIFACDTFSGHAVVDERFDGRHRAHSQFSDVRLTDVQAYLKESRNVRVIAGDIHDTWAEIPSDRPIGLLHVDVDVYPATKFCLQKFGPKISNEGFIVCDDYGFTTCLGAKEAVDEFCAENPEWKIFHLLTGQALLFKTAQ